MNNLNYGFKEHIIGKYKILSNCVSNQVNDINEKEILKSIKDNFGDTDYYFLIFHCLNENNTITYLISKTLVEIDKYNGVLYLNELINMLKNRLSNEDVTKRLIEKNLSISTMESCTSGLIASTITDTEGASGILQGSAITYSNKYKIVEGVSEKIIDKYGVYSAETAKEMASAANRKYLSKISIGVTGSAGRIDPNNADSISGIIYYCIFVNPNIFYETKIIFFDVSISRKEMKEIIVEKVLNKLNSII